MSAVAAAGAAVLLAACSSSSSNSFTTSAGSGAHLTGTPIKVMFTGTIHSSIFNRQDDLDAMKARTDAINAAGGIHGHPVKLTICDAQEDPNIQATCARQAVTQGDVAVVNGFTAAGAGVAIPILQPAGIAYLNPGLLAANELASKVSFPVTGGIPSAYSALGQEMASKGCSKGGAIVVQNPAAQAAVKFFETGLQAHGGSVVKTVQTPTSTPDYSSAVAALQSAGVQCAALVVTSAELPKTLLAFSQANYDIPKGGPSDAFTPAILNSPGADGSIVAGTAYQPTDPQARQALDEIKKYTGDGAPSGSALQTWAAAKVLYEAMDKISGDITASSVLAALGSLTDAQTGVTAPLTTTEPNPDPAFARIFDNKALTWTIKNGKYVLNSSDFLTVKI
jgi:ABC-type branched-subunit amino acid transport system substrate-binding protein